MTSLDITSVQFWISWRDGGCGHQVPLQAGKHLKGLSKNKGTSDHNKNCPESLGAEDKGEEAEEEDEELHEGGEDGGDHLLRIW